MVCSLAASMLQVAFFRPRGCSVFHLYNGSQLFTQQYFFVYCVCVTICLQNNVVFVKELYTDFGPQKPECSRMAGNLTIL